jgi:hypothetical protein
MSLPPRLKRVRSEIDELRLAIGADDFDDEGTTVMYSTADLAWLLRVADAAQWVQEESWIEDEPALFAAMSMLRNILDDEGNNE